MRWNRQDQNDGSLNDVNMTPLIDVSLVLVVILLLATPLAFESSFALRETGRSAQQSQEENDVTRIELEVLSDAEVRVNRDVVPVAILEQILKPLLKDAESRDVTVDCAGAVSHGTFVTVLDAAKSSGAKNIAVVGR